MAGPKMSQLSGRGLGAEGTRRPPIALIYDGRCGFCVAQSARLVRLARPGSVEALDAHAPGVLERFGGLVTRERAMAALQVVEPSRYAGSPVRVSEGCEGVVRVLATRRGVGLLAHIYYLPIVRWLCDAAYRWIARNRYTISRWWPGASKDAMVCEGGACGIAHPAPRPRPAERVAKPGA